MSNQVASTVSTNIVPVQGQFDQNGNCQGLIGPGGEVFFPPLVGDAITGVTIDNSVIGSNTAASGTFTRLNVMSLASLNGKLIMSSTPPTIASGFVIVLLALSIFYILEKLRKSGNQRISFWGYIYFFWLMIATSLNWYIIFMN